MKHTQKGQVFTDIVLQVFKVNGLLGAEGDRLTKEFALSSARWKVLGAIEMSASPITVPQIARVMGLTRQAVQRLADVMEKDGLLIYQNNPHHKRAKLVVLTEKGDKIYSSLSEMQMQWANQKSENISQSDLNNALTVLQKIALLFES